MVLVTAPDREEANAIAERLLAGKLAACVNVVGSVASRFLWGDEIDEARECLLIIKSRRSMFKEITETVKAVHSYEVPEVIALPIVGGNPDYLNWIDESLGR